MNTARKKNCRPSARLKAALPLLLLLLSGGTQGLSASRESSPATTMAIYAAVVSSDSNPTGIYRIPTDGSGTLTQVYANSYLKPTGGGCMIEDTYYCVVDNSSGETLSAQGFAFSSEPWAMTGILSPDYKCLATDVAYDPTTGKVYGCFTDIDADGLPCYVFGTIDYATCTRTKICALADKWNAVAVDSEGTIWAIDRMGILKKVTDKTTGTVQNVAMTMLFPEYNSTGAIDPRTDTFYYSYSGADGTSSLYAISLATKSVEKICQYEANDRLAGMYIVNSSIASGAPAAVSDLKATFADGSLLGTVEFTAPTQTVGGETGSGTLTYSIRFGSEEMATGTAEYGQRVNATVELPQAGSYTVAVAASNAVGEGPATTIDAAWYGYDTPKKPDHIALSYTESNFSLSWDAVTEGVHGGYINAAEVSYSIVRHPDNTAVASGIAGHSFAETMPEPTALTTYYYTITAHFAGNSSEEGASNKITLGHAVAPYAEDFGSESSLDAFTIIDNNGDGQRWLRSNAGYAYMTYSETLAMDDWLITPAILLEGGKSYEFSFEASNQKNISGTTIYDEKIEAFMGRAATVEAMAERVVEQTTLTSGTMERLGRRVEVATTGLYHFGLHGCSDAAKWYLMIDNISLIELEATEVPARISDLTVKPDSDGALQAEISLTAPDTTSAGKPLASLTSIEIRRDGSTIKTFASPEKGSHLSFSDIVGARGIYTYTAIASGASGNSPASTAKVYIGVNEPAAPPSASAAETSNDGEVTISWQPTVLDVDGFPLNSNDISYTIYDNRSDIPVANGVAGTSFTYRAAEAGSKQEFKYYHVFTNVNPGRSDAQYGQHAATTNQVAVGTPYALPFVESFGESDHDYAWAYERPVGSLATWEIVADNAQVSPIAAAFDADSAMLMFHPLYKDEEAIFYSAKISVAQAEDPVLTFYYYAVEGGRDEFDVMARNAGQSHYSTLRTIALGDAATTGWTKCAIHLKEAMPSLGGTIQVAFNGREAEARNYVLIDCLRIIDMPQHDLAALALSSPDRVDAGQPVSVGVAIENIGAQPSADYTVELYRNGQLAHTFRRAGIAADSIDRFEFNDPTNAMTESPVRYQAKLNYGGDTDPTNNLSRTSTTALARPPYETVDDLAATVTADGVELSWTAPENATFAEQTCESFEDYEGWTTASIGPWTAINANSSLCGGFSDVSLPTDNSAASFFVFDSSDPTAASLGRLPHSGDKFIASMFKYKDGSYCRSDDWLISPELSGNRQTVTFFASSYDPNYPESIELYYSTLGNEPVDFLRLESRPNIESGWHKCQFTLPEGARYFAIRAVSDNMFLLMIDDICFEAASAVRPLSILGYNIYRNGAKLNATPIAETRYTDAETTEGTVCYNVSVVYSRGESAVSNTAELSLSGITNAAAIGAARVYTVGCGIAIEGASGQEVRVYSLGGQAVHSCRCSDRTLIPLPGGAYIVRIGHTTMKIIVR